jgi:hydroxymethylpyrimidine/phosphomethylpyrimidine kinase
MTNAKETTKCILTVAGSDSGGGAGIQADVKTIAALDAYGMCVITAVTAQNTQGVQDVHEIPPEFVRRQFDSVASDISIDAVKTGMLAGPETVRVVADRIRTYKLQKVVVDPVLSAKGGTSLLYDDAVSVLKTELIPLATVVTPNIPEAEILSGLPIVSPEDMKQAARIIHLLGAKNVVIKGGHAAGDPVDLLFDGEQFFEFRSERLSTADTHGTGCTFATALAIGIAEDLSVRDAVDRAKRLIFAAIRSSLRIGQGHGPVNPMAFISRHK